MKEALLESQSAKYVFCAHKRLRAYAYAVKNEKVCEKIVREIGKKIVCEKIVCECDGQTHRHTHTETDGF